MRLLLLSVLSILFAFSSYAQTFNGTGGAIPGSGSSPTCFNASVTGLSTSTGTSFGLSQVCMTITHTSIDELEILLQAPDGTYVPLTIQNGNSGSDNYTNTCFSASANTPIKFGAAPFTGSFLPEGHLGAVNNGQNPNGTWKLCILDRRTPGNAGNLVSWSITFSNTPAPQPPAFPACNTTIPSTSDCASASSICDFNGACGSTTGSTKRSWTALDNASCFGLNNNSFVKFIADAPTVSFSVWVTSSNNGFNNANGGIQMLFFSTPTCGGAVTTYGCYNRIYPYASTSKPLISVIYAEGLTPGNTYYLLTDGANGDLCNFRISANSGVNVLNISSNSPSNNICLGETVTFNATGGNGIYNWGANNAAAGLSSSSGSTVNATPTTTGLIRYSLNSVTGLGCPTSSSIDINVSPQPAAPVFNITQPSCTTPTGTITFTTVTGATYSIDGLNFQSSNIFSGLAPGNYTLKIKNAGGCTSPSTTAIISPTPTGITQAYIYSIIDPTCTNNTGGIVIQQPLGNNYEYNLNGGPYQNTPSFSNLPSGNYTTSVRDKITGCFTPASSFTIIAAPVVPAAPAITLVQPTCALPTGSISIATISGLTYSIDGNNYQPNNIFSGLNPGNYNVTVKNTAGCTSAITQVTINNAPNSPAAPTISISQPTCSTSTGTITVTQGTGLTYSIDGNNYQSNNIFSGLNQGNYNVTVKNTAGCTSAITQATINNAPNSPAAPTISISQPTCSTSTGTITVTQGTGLTYSIDGNNYQPNNIFSGLNPGNYNVTVKNTAGCVSSITQANINNAPNSPAAPTISITQPTCSTSTGTITVTQVAGVTYSINGNNYQTSNVFSGLISGNYSLKAKNAAGCISTAIDAVINNQPDCTTQDLFVPNAFTPNGDGKNDILFVKGTTIKSMQLLIFNQWGEKIFEAVKQEQGWDGSVGGKAQPVGVYVYILKVGLNNGKTQQLKGSITLIR